MLGEEKSEWDGYSKKYEEIRSFLRREDKNIIKVLNFECRVVEEENAHYTPGGGDEISST